MNMTKIYKLYLIPLRWLRWEQSNGLCKSPESSSWLFTCVNLGKSFISWWCQLPPSVKRGQGYFSTLRQCLRLSFDKSPTEFNLLKKTQIQPRYKGIRNVHFSETCTLDNVFRWHCRCWTMWLFMKTVMLIDSLGLCLHERECWG